MKYLLPSALLVAASAHATDYPLTPDAPPQTFYVNGPFSDNLDFTAAVDGVYSFKVIPANYAVSCGPRGCRSAGRIATTITGSQVRNAQGTSAIADVVYSTQVTLAAGSYALNVTGAGQGTGRYVGLGNYSVTVAGPPQALPCEWYDTRNLPRDPGCTGP